MKNLGQVKYLSTMKHVNLIVGNSSSGIIEAASFKKAVVNIGRRQEGRLKGQNIIDCNIASLGKSIELAISSNFRNKINNIENIYGTGQTAAFIEEKLIKSPLSLIKKFRDQS